MVGYWISSQFKWKFKYCVIRITKGMGNKIIFRRKYRFRVINAKRCAFEKYFWKCKCFFLTINWKGEKWQKKRKNSKKLTKLFSVGKGTSRYRIETHKGSSESPRPIVGTRRHSANPTNLNYLKIGPTFGQFQHSYYIFPR